MLDGPHHVAIIPDGNRRWAREHYLPSFSGHEKGVDALRDVLEVAYDLHIECFSVWGSSLANLIERNKKEVQSLEKIYQNYFRKLAKERRIHQEQIKVRVLGEWETTLGRAARHSIQLATRATERYNRLYLNFFIAYDGKVEMLAAVQRILEKAQEQNEFKITPELVKENLLTRDLPPVDLLIRTGGEPHLSAGFMMWEIGESQLFFSEKYWPDFTGDDLKEAIRDFQKRERRLAR